MEDWNPIEAFRGYVRGDVLPGHTDSQRYEFWKNYVAASTQVRQWLKPVERGLRVSLATVITESTKIDLDGRGISKGGILGNSDAKAYYDRHKSWKGPKRSKSAGSGGQNAPTAQRPIDPNRDTARVWNRLTRKGKDELADRVLELEQGCAVQEGFSEVPKAHKQRRSGIRR